ncbi:PHP domain-containing protein [Salinicoccus halodurans]|uniref:Phosphoesterase n=1 Tax=Salinicoccus halodurans TaxID=407035 RepID=A0A0F7HKF2_9STAP|nr:PHP domain-containing protein [Salinicoccus halodurans]AKG73561.1 phosphoesterase [Salinicoccus halodurans]SFK52591.1 hypothetical protein SAMN05216235_0162 [Salinicoccus halodurans]
MTLIDLHVHSSLSDGSDSYRKVLEVAKEKDVAVLSFVDHDITATYRPASRVAGEFGIKLIPGIEISAYDFKRNRKVHVLGYDYDLNAENIHELTKPLLRRRHAHSLRQIEQIRAFGVDVDVERIASRLGGAQTIYKQHIMEEITDAPFTSEEYQNLYRKLFKGDGPAAGDIRYIDVKDAIRAVKADGGFAVIAHPGQLDSYAMIEECVEIGIDGIEQFHPDHTAEDFERVQALADRFDLFTTGGSDYHGHFGAKVDVGIDKNLLTNLPFD